MQGPIWESVLFPQDHDITDSNIYLVVAVLFFVVKNTMICGIGSLASGVS